MKRFRTNKKNKNTIKIFGFIVFFCVINSIILFNLYSKKVTKNSTIIIQEKLDKIIYQFFTDLITNDIINLNSVGNLLKINKNDAGEILSVDYNLEKTYKILTDTSQILKKGLTDLENGTINVDIYDKYLENGQNGLILNIPLFLGVNNIFLNNLGPMIPVLINFNNALLTNIKTKVTNYGFNNALLEIYITVEIKKMIITPIIKDEKPFYYDILIGALVVNGKVPNFYGGQIESNSSILDIPMNY